MPFEYFTQYLSTEERNELENYFTTKSFKRGASIYEESSKILGVYFVVRGQVKRCLEGIEGRECIFDVLGVNDVFGHRNLFHEGEHFDSAVAMTDCEIAFIPKNQFMQLVKTNPNINTAFIKLLSAESVRHILHAKVLSQLDLRQRMAYYFIYILGKYRDPNQLIIEISRDDLANLLGTVKESAVRTMQRFKEEGTIMASGRKIYIANRQALLDIAKIYKEELSL